MNSNNLIVDDFLSGGGSHFSAQPPRHNDDDGLDVPLNSNNSGDFTRDPQSLARVFSLQQRLATLMKEAQDIVEQLQNCGMFPRSTSEGNEAVTLLMGLCAGASAPAASAAPLAQSRAAATAGVNNFSAMNESSMWASHQKENNATTASSQALSSGMSNVLAGNNSADNLTHTHRHHNSNDNSNNMRGGKKNNADAYGYGSGADGVNGPNADMVAFVEFKRGRIRKYLCEDSTMLPGRYVLVDGDRGTDCGLLVQTHNMQPDGFVEILSMEGCEVDDAEKMKLENGRVLRAASTEDTDRLHNIISTAEGVALKTCRECCEKLDIDINLLDAEYQFDMKKISFFFDCDHSVDFRTLVRELHRTFGARIWMENINPKVKNVMPTQEGGEERAGGHGGDHSYKRRGRGGGGGGYY